MFNIQNYSKQNIKNDVLSGALVAVALVPEAIAFSFIAGVSPVVGLYGAFIIGLVTAIIGGKPGMISGATGSVAVVFVALGISISEMYPDLGKEALSMMILNYILLTSIIAGFIQIGIGLFKMGKFIRLVPQPALFGFVNGLAIVIALAQLPFLAPKDMGQYSGKWMDIITVSFTENYIMYIIIAITMATMYFLPKVSKAVPAGLVAIVVLTIVTYFMHIDTKVVGDLADLSNVSMPSFVMPLAELFTFSSMSIILPTALIVALVGLIESLLTL
ncbi:MAG: SulP family inorganic anion transporter, partial [Sulfurovum sp.]|nr:SulP family inorganic anion transporter [Sulfurovum sp.]